MKNVIIFGTGATSKVVLSGLRKDVNVVCYCDNDETKSKKIYNNRQIIYPKDIKNFNFDYVIIASQFNDEIYNQLVELNIEKEKIFEFFKYIDSFWNYVQYDIQNFIDNRDSIEGIVTGISYAERGIKENLLSKKIVKMTRQSQDLYYDYNLVKHVMRKSGRKFPRLKYALISLSYYSFEYDMSSSSMKGKVSLYYQAIGKKHNLVDIDKYITKRNNNNHIAKEIFNLNPNGYPQIDWNVNQSNRSINTINDDYGMRQAILDCNKNYPETVKENTQILKEYLELLKEYDIKPIVIICPGSKFYTRHFSNLIREEFYSIINEIKGRYNFEFLDYFNSRLFEDDDFYDVSHLNDKGAEKFTKILDNDINWDNNLISD